ncbi:ubiquitin-specific protease otu1, partial [Nowakowskiella sp. JEL0078]
YNFQQVKKRISLVSREKHRTLQKIALDHWSQNTFYAQPPKHKVVKTMRLRLRGTKGQTLVGASLAPNSLLSELKTEIWQATGVTPERQLLKSGFPPKPIIANDSDSLLTAQLRDGDQLILEDCDPQAVIKTITSLRRTTPTQTMNSAEIPKDSETNINKTSIAKTISPLVNADLNSKPSVLSNKSSSMMSTISSDLIGSNQSTKSLNSIQTSDGAFLVVRFIQEMKDDNSCLFHSIGYVLEGTPDAVSKLRKIVAEEISSNPDFSEAILGKSRQSYIEWISQPKSWGGAIELSIFSKYYQVEIDSIDVATLRVDRFGEGQYDKRVFLIYSGIHYDAVALSFDLNAPSEFDQTSFGLTESEILKAAVDLAGILKKQRKFTDLANFSLKCGICKIGLKGQSEAQEHAMETGHTSFEEF